MENIIKLDKATTNSFMEQQIKINACDELIMRGAESIHIHNLRQEGINILNNIASSTVKAVEGVKNPGKVINEIDWSVDFDTQELTYTVK